MERCHVSFVSSPFDRLDHGIEKRIDHGEDTENDVIGLLIVGLETIGDQLDRVETRIRGQGSLIDIARLDPFEQRVEQKFHIGDLDRVVSVFQLQNLVREIAMLVLIGEFPGRVTGNERQVHE